MSRQAACVLCQAPADQSLPDRDGYRLCRRCDVAWSPAEDPADPAGEWDRDYYGDETLLQLHLARESAMKGIVHRLAKLAPIRGRLLDVGTGVGVLLKVAASDGWRSKSSVSSPIPTL